MQKYNRFIAKIVLASISLIVLLFINFSIWGGTYSKDDIEYNIHYEMQMIEDSNITADAMHEVVSNVLSILSLAILLTAGILLVVHTLHIVLHKMQDDYIVLNSLVARSVRLNN